jgi:hypothetical protein
MPVVSGPLRAHDRDDLAEGGVEGAHRAAAGGFGVLPGIRGPPSLPTAVARTHSPAERRALASGDEEKQGCFAVRDGM